MMNYYMISLKEEYLNRILEGTKKYEFRRVFASSLDEPFLCAIYVSSPIQKIKGIIYFDKPIRDSVDNLLDLARKSKYPYIQSVKNYFDEKNTGYALPVLKINMFNNPISLEDLQNIHPNFRPPQSFYSLEREQFLKLKDYIQNYEL